MKTILSIVIVIILQSNCSSKVQSNPEEQIIAMLKEFYTSYNDVWTSPLLNNDVMNKKLDSLMIKYCTSSLRIEAKKQLELGMELLTNNLVNVDLNENLKVEKDLIKVNEYVVSFTATNSDAANNPIKQRVVIHVTVVKEADVYKIDSVR